jgi:hypothetical protein
MQALRQDPTGQQVMRGTTQQRQIEDLLAGDALTDVQKQYLRLQQGTGGGSMPSQVFETPDETNPIVFVDEATMIDARMLKAVVETYKDRSKIIIAGDIRVTGVPASKPPVWFQCRNRTDVFDPRAYGCQVVTYETDYRATGPLVAMKQAVRDAMLEVFLGSSAEDPGDDTLDAHAVALRVKDIFAPFLTTSDVCATEYAPGDTILVGTHELGDGWTEALKDRDERYRVTRHTGADVVKAQTGEGEGILLTGDITSKKVPNAQFCLAFTIHSFQGKTFAGRRLWIDARRVWDYAMLYTAISRCQTADQIRIFFE